MNLKLTEFQKGMIVGAFLAIFGLIIGQMVGSASAWGNGGFPQPIGDSGQQQYNPLAPALNIPDKGTAVPNNPYGSGNAVVYNPNSGGSSSSGNYIPAPVPVPTPAMIVQPAIIATPRPTIPPEMLLPPPTPAPTTAPSPGIIAAMALKELPSSPTPIISKTNSPFGTMIFNTTPACVNVSIDNRTLRECTPTARDFSPGNHIRVNFTKEGYEMQSFIVSLKDGERLPFNITMKKIVVRQEIRSEERTSNSSQVELSFAPPYQSKDDTTTTTTNDTELPENAIFVVIVVVMSGALVVGCVVYYFWKNGRGRDDDIAGKGMSQECDSCTTPDDSITIKTKAELILNNPTLTRTEKVLRIKKIDPEYSNKKLAEHFGCSERTIERDQE